MTAPEPSPAEQREIERFGIFDTEELLDALEAAHAEATPGPWTAATAPAEGSDETHAEYLTGALRPDEGRPLWVAWAPIVDGLHDTDYVVPIVTGDGPTSEANARFASLAHDALPVLTAAVRAALALADELDDVAKDYRHVPSGTHDAGARNAHMAIAGRIRSTVTAALDPS